MNPSPVSVDGTRFDVFLDEPAAMSLQIPLSPRPTSSVQLGLQEVTLQAAIGTHYDQEVRAPSIPRLQQQPPEGIARNATEESSEDVDGGQGHVSDAVRRPGAGSSQVSPPATIVANLFSCLGCKRIFRRKDHLDRHLGTVDCSKKISTNTGNDSPRHKRADNKGKGVKRQRDEGAAEDMRPRDTPEEMDSEMKRSRYSLDAKDAEIAALRKRIDKLEAELERERQDAREERRVARVDKQESAAERRALRRERPGGGKQKTLGYNKW